MAQTQTQIINQVITIDNITPLLNLLINSKGADLEERFSNLSITDLLNCLSKAPKIKDITFNLYINDQCFVNNKLYQVYLDIIDLLLNTVINLNIIAYNNVLTIVNFEQDDSFPGAYAYGLCGFIFNPALNIFDQTAFKTDDGKILYNGFAMNSKKSQIEAQIAKLQAELNELN